jgi:hypothetical protein
MNADPNFFALHGLATPVAEYRFHPERRWRFDLAWPEYRLALEIEGGLWVGGRHNSPQGFFRDLEKYNAAAVLGWRILRVTPKAVGTLVTIQLVRDAMKASA